MTLGDRPEPAAAHLHRHQAGRFPTKRGTPGRHDSLAATVERELGLDAHSGALYVFRAKRADRVKILAWDGSGLVLIYKRLDDGKFAWPAIQDGVMRLSKAQFEALFEGLDWRRVHSRRIRRPQAAQ